MNIRRIAVLALGAGLLLGVAAAPAAHAAAFTEQCDQSGFCMNLWNGGPLVKSWHGTTANNSIAVQWINAAHTQFELRDNVVGGCVGNYGGAQNDERASGQRSCPSSGHADWGTVFNVDHSVCPAGWAGYRNQHSGRYIYLPSGNGAQVYLNSSVDCLHQIS